MPLEEIEQRFHGAVALEAGHRVQDPTSWASQEVGDALAGLPESFRTALLTVDVDKLTYEQAAVAIGCPVGTVRSRLSRARRIVYAELYAYAKETGYLG